MFPVPSEGNFDEFNIWRSFNKKCEVRDIICYMYSWVNSGRHQKLDVIALAVLKMGGTYSGTVMSHIDKSDDPEIL